MDAVKAGDVRFNVFFPREDWNRLVEMADRAGESKAKTIRKAVKLFQTILEAAEGRQWELLIGGQRVRVVY